MSADNFISVRLLETGWFWGMGFASDDYDFDELPISEHSKGPFETAVEAEDDARLTCPVIEYGFVYPSIHSAADTERRVAE